MQDVLMTEHRFQLGWQLLVYYYISLLITHEDQNFLHHPNEYSIYTVH